MSLTRGTFYIIVVIVVLLKGCSRDDNGVRTVKKDYDSTVSNYSDLEDRYRELETKYSELELRVSVLENSAYNGGSSVSDENSGDDTGANTETESYQREIQVVPAAEPSNVGIDVVIMDEGNQRISLPLYDSLAKAQSYPKQIYNRNGYSRQIILNGDGIGEIQYIFDNKNAKNVDEYALSVIDSDYFFNIEVGNEKLTTVVIQVNGHRYYTTVLPYKGGEATS